MLSNWSSGQVAIGAAVVSATVAALTWVAMSLSRMSIRTLWERCTKIPYGRWIFSKLVGFVAPYSASVSPRILELRDNHAVVRIKEHRAIQNPFKSIHLAALINAGELATGLAVLYTIRPGQRAIPTKVSAEFLTKARGEIMATCDTQLPLDDERKHSNFEVTSVMTDSSGTKVCVVKVEWSLDFASKKNT